MFNDIDDWDSGNDRDKLLIQIRELKKERDTLQVRVGEMAAEVERLSSTFGHDTIVNQYLPLMRQIYTVITDLKKATDHDDLSIKSEPVIDQLPEIESFMAQIGEKL